MIIRTPGYPVKFIQRKKHQNASGHISTYIFSFLSFANKLKYVVHVEEYDEQLCAIKFYPKCLRKSDFKYNKIINKGDVINVLMSVASVIPHLLQENTKFSFGFVGSRSVNTMNNYTEHFIANKRYRIYSELIKQVIGDRTFVHIEYEQISGYLLLNKAAGDIDYKENKIKKMLNNIYTFIEELQ
ncbi:MAG: hypothetical protein C0424_11510 [Sphingobacteriaceae bacterium]|nr:hypothetical protein [Sphingobacteriaceae bacterium]